MSFEPFVKNSKPRPLIPADAEVTEHKVPDWSKNERPSYGQIKSRFKAEIVEKSSNSRFSLSEQVANSLSLEKEEQRRFDKKVSEAVNGELNRLRDDAKTTAYAEGLERGRAEAFEREKARIAEQLEKMKGLISNLEQAKENLGAQYEKILIDVAFRLAKTLVHRELKQSPEVIVGTISEILQRISKEDDVVIKISSHEFEALDLIRNELKESSRGGRINFELDESLPSGGCVVESSGGEIASYLDEKIKKLEDAVMRGHQTSSGNEGTGT